MAVVNRLAARGGCAVLVLFLCSMGWADTDMEVTGNLKVTSTSGNGNATASGKIGIGVTTPGSKLEIKGDTGTSLVTSIQNEGSSTSTQIDVGNANSAPGTYRNIIRGKESRGTLSSPSAVSSGDYILSILGGLYANSAFRDAVGINFLVDGTPGTNDYPTRITFETTADGGSGRVERMRIRNNGYVGIGDFEPVEKLTVGSGYIAIATYGVPDSDGDYAKFYVDQGQMYVMDDGAMSTQLTSHRDPRTVAPDAATSFDDPSVTLPFSFHHSNAFIGKGAVVDLAALVKDVEAVTGKAYTYIYDLSPEEVLDFEQWREEQRVKREQRAREEALAAQPEVEVSLGESYEEVPEMEVVEAVEQASEYRINFDTLQVETVTVDRKVFRENPTGRTKRQLKPDIRFDPETGKLWRRRALEEVQVADLPAPTLPEWVAARVPAPGR
ncbi:MAG: hypothetical protein GHCLOJNM_03423 [bacterium]|nr:hypothetical protein [bacterium]